MGRPTKGESIGKRVLEAASGDEITASAIHDLAVRLGLDRRAIKRTLETQGWIVVYRRKE